MSVYLVFQSTGFVVVADFAVPFVVVTVVPSGLVSVTLSLSPIVFDSVCDVFFAAISVLPFVAVFKINELLQLGAYEHNHDMITASVVMSNASLEPRDRSLHVSEVTVGHRLLGAVNELQEVVERTFLVPLIVVGQEIHQVVQRFDL
ncbi:MAG: hypothetical protein APF80_12455 [Alphaproteobacteria bacterium BRH_c36]|nr:MAG: hypothetical protein APF80_12455 [Alphaproteobacteria bacterium BRH_c36]